MHDHLGQPADMAHPLSTAPVWMDGLSGWEMVWYGMVWYGIGAELPPRWVKGSISDFMEVSQSRANNSVEKLNSDWN